MGPADQFSANSGLKSQEFSEPVLGHIVLRFAEVRFAQHTKLERVAASSRRGSRLDEPDFVLANLSLNYSDRFCEEQDVRWQFSIQPKGSHKPRTLIA